MRNLLGYHMIQIFMDKVSKIRANTAPKWATVGRRIMTASKGVYMKIKTLYHLLVSVLASHNLVPYKYTSGGSWYVNRFLVSVYVKDKRKMEVKVQTYFNDRSC